jgi:PAS domain S-box-containing protein
MAKTISKEIEKDLRLLHFTVENLQEAIFWIDAQAKIIEVNRAACELYGYTAKELLKITTFDLNPEMDLTKWKIHWNNTKKQKKLVFDSKHKHKDGSFFEVEITNNYISFEGNEYACCIVRDLSKKKREEKLIQLISEGTAGVIGMDFFETLSKYITIALNVRFAIVTECMHSDKSRVRTICFAEKGNIIDNIEYDVEKFPCAKVMRGEDVFIPENLEIFYPEEKGLEAYMAVPILSPSTGEILGHLAGFDTRKFERDENHTNILKIFAARAGAEIERKVALEKLKIANAELKLLLNDSEERFKDLFEEAPIAYVHEGLDSKFIRANRAALRILGVRPDQVATIYSKTLAPDTPEAQKRMKEAFESVGRGTDTSGVVLELKRKDNGKPIWIQWWSNPDRSGTFTRTMFIDITDKVLMEQEQERLQAQNQYLQDEIKLTYNFDEIISKSKNFHKVLRKVEQVAATDATVLILGESGTGKELLCRAIHHISKRSNKPLVKVNCAALPANLIESELFGHEKGAFTGATERKIGRFELADGGTIFLDELGELPIELQSKLLRILQEGEFERLGNPKTMKVNVRIIAATNRDLQKEIEKNNFREDLFYRLNVFPIESIPLRERMEDVPLLIKHFCKKYESKIGKKITDIPKKVIDKLMDYDFPGNIRELENIIERALIISNGQTLELGDWLPKKSMYTKTKVVDLNSVEKSHIIEVLTKVNWKVSGEHGAAKILGLKPTTLEARMKKLGITRIK